MQKAKNSFFPDGHSSFGSRDDCVFDLAVDVKGEHVISEGETVQGTVDRTKIKSLRYYLLSRLIESDEESLPSMKLLQKDVSIAEHSVVSFPSASTSSEQAAALFEQPNPGLSEVTVPGAVSMYEVNADGLSQEVANHYQDVSVVTVLKTPESIPVNTVFEQVSNRPESAVMSEACTNEDVNTVSVALINYQDQGSSTMPETIMQDDEQSSPHSCTVLTIMAFRGNVFDDLNKYFKTFDLLQARYEIQLILPDGKCEVAEDCGGVLRDALSEY